MPSIGSLTELAALTSAGLPPDEAVQRALPLLQEGLGAADVRLVYGSDSGFRSFGRGTANQLSDVALWLVDEDLARRDEACAFDLQDDRVVDFRSANSARPCRNVAALIPMSSRTGEMLVASGSWPDGLGPVASGFLQAALPTVALLMERRLDSSRAERQRNQLSALASIPAVMRETEDLETVLTSIAGTIATVTGIDYISIDLVDAHGKVGLRCLNSGRPGVQERRGRWTRGASKPDPVRDTVLKTRRAMLFRDSQNDDRIPESGRNFFVRALIRSTACFPLLAKDEVLGILSVASHRPLEFTNTEVELVEGFAAQVGSVVKGIQLYQELARSRRQLESLNKLLQENMGVEHHLARTDSLTGIPNRRSIDETIDAEFARAVRYKEPLSVVMADLDNLKDINDTFGHDAGDAALKFLANEARESCRRTDLVGRYGGDEFVFVLPSTRLQDAALFAERFRERLAETLVPVTDRDLARLTVSLGVAQWDGESMDEATSLVRQADRVMYEAKAAGRNRTMLADGGAARAA